MQIEINQLQEKALAALKAASDAASLKAVRVHFLGKAGAISQLSEGMKNLSKEERPVVGKLLNELRSLFTEALEAKETALALAADAALFADLDPTLPGTPLVQGGMHPLTLLTDRVIQIFRRLGFALATGPDIDSEWYCFDALNTPVHHPARNDQDTFYFPDGRLLRTQTSTVQIRAMEQAPPPLRIIAPGSAYRRDEIDATHLSQFTQMEVLCVAPGITLADLKGTAEFFFRELFGPETECRFRPHFFPFTEPSFEIDIRSSFFSDKPLSKLAAGDERQGIDGAQRLSVQKVLDGASTGVTQPIALAVEFGKRSNKWLELAGCGMVDPAVFEAINQKRGDRAYDPDKVSGFAFGFGLERLVMMLTGTPDIRMLTENDLRFLERFVG